MHDLCHIWRNYRLSTVPADRTVKQMLDWRQISSEEGSQEYQLDLQTVRTDTWHLGFVCVCVCVFSVCVRAYACVCVCDKER